MAAFDGCLGIKSFHFRYQMYINIVNLSDRVPQQKFSLFKMEWMLLYICIFAVARCNIFQIDTSYDLIWEQYKEKFNKSYSGTDEDARRIIWEKNVRMIMKHNLEAEFGWHPFTMTLNKFSDMTEQEKDVYRNCVKHRAEPSETASHVYRNKCDKNCFLSLPREVDWRTKGFVTAVKDQDNCGSCWAFAATGALEGQNRAKRGYLVSLSEQNLLDCSWKQGNMGCRGGWLEYSFQYVIDNEGIDTEDSYPYEAQENVCRFQRGGVGANCTNYAFLPRGSETDLQAAVATIGPISVNIDAGGQKFPGYRQGVYVDDTCSSDKTNHAVLVVGYGTENGIDYWLAKNSWGTLWGMDGYIKMARNRNNQCGIATHAVYPIV